VFRISGHRLARTRVLRSYRSQLLGWVAFVLAKRIESWERPQLSVGAKRLLCYALPMRGSIFWIAFDSGCASGQMGYWAF
jgi:hypothetical protein